MSKKNKHARNQAKYMERKREAGLEWLTEWVPQPACQAFKAIAKAARKSHGVPSEARLAEAEGLAAARQDELPDWAKSLDVLLSLWMTSTVAEAALDQIQAEREANKSKKAEAKAAKSTPESGDVEEPAAEPEQHPAAPAKRARKKAVVAPPDAAPTAAAPE
ncbi:MAG: hypothetical protein WCO00_17130 [Rhodospirillaceae bacterium]